jgi:hypothetical protein
MGRGLNIRKPVDDLTAIDFDQFPIWEYALDEEGKRGQDETWVRPLPDVEVADGIHFAAADVTLADGTKLSGFAEVITMGEFEITSLTVFEGANTALLPSLEPSPREQRDAAESLRRPMAKVFPLLFRLRVTLVNESQVRAGVV